MPRLLEALALFSLRSSNSWSVMDTVIMYFRMGLLAYINNVASVMRKCVIEAVEMTGLQGGIKIMSFL